MMNGRWRFKSGKWPEARRDRAEQQALAIAVLGSSVPPAYRGSLRPVGDSCVYCSRQALAARIMGIVCGRTGRCESGNRFEQRSGESAQVATPP